jgi:hypothetical protein
VPSVLFLFNFYNSKIPCNCCFYKDILGGFGYYFPDYYRYSTGFPPPYELFTDSIFEAGYFFKPGMFVHSVESYSLLPTLYENFKYGVSRFFSIISNCSDFLKSPSSAFL